jgi:DNA-binding CsgD family transcriptional regulator/N-acetylneuraminic acid mutarotase
VSDDNETTIPLSNRELQVLEMVATGASNQQIARQLVISVNTVKVHLRNIFEKLDVQSRTEATLRAIQEGWIVVDNATETPEENVTSTRTFLLNTGVQANLTRWQQIYLVAVLLLALVVMTLPLIPKAAPKIRPNLPVIYAQPPTPVPVTTSSGSWAAQAPMPTKRAGLGLVALNGHIFAIGGVRANNKATRSVEIYDPTADSWSEGAAKPTAASSIVGVVYDDKIYVPGGCTDRGQPLNSLEIYDPQTDSWEQGQSLPAARCAYGLTVFQDKLYLFGGWNGQSFEDTVLVYSPHQDSWQVLETTMPQAKGYVGAATLNDSIYVVGGFDGKNEFNHTHIFVPATDEWLEKSPMRENRGGLGLISAANNLYVVGGGWDQPVSSSEKYDPATDTWTTFEAPFSHQWRNMGLAATDTRIYAVGGWDGTEEKFMDSTASHQYLFQFFLPVTIQN